MSRSLGEQQLDQRLFCVSNIRLPDAQARLKLSRASAKMLADPSKAVAGAANGRSAGCARTGRHRQRSTGAYFSLARDLSQRLLETRIPKKEDGGCNTTGIWAPTICAAPSPAAGPALYRTGRPRPDQMAPQGRRRWGRAASDAAAPAGALQAAAPRGRDACRRRPEHPFGSCESACEGSPND